MKKYFAVFAALLLSLLALTGCMGKHEGDDVKMLKIGATSVPHAEILEQVKPILEQQGIHLEIVEFNDYVQPNLAVNDKELDANFFQHLPYLNNFMEEHPEVHLVNAGAIHIEPMGIYSKKLKDLTSVPDGATVAIPNDPTNGGRSLLLLEKAGLLKLKDGVNEKATVNDIADNPKHLKFQEVEAAQVPRTLDDVTLAVINTNYAMQANLVPTKDALFMEDKTSLYVNIIAVRQGDENRPEIQALVKALQSDTIRQFMEEHYKGAIVPAF